MNLSKYKITNNVNYFWLTAFLITFCRCKRHSFSQTKTLPVETTKKWCSFFLIISWRFKWNSSFNINLPDKIIIKVWDNSFEFVTIPSWLKQSLFEKSFNFEIESSLPTLLFIRVVRSEQRNSIFCGKTHRRLEFVIL